MGSTCSKDTTDKSELSNAKSANVRVSQDPTLILPNFKDMKRLI